MNLKELKKYRDKLERNMRLEELERELFLLDMKDHFTSRDFERKEELSRKIAELENEYN